MAKHCSQPPESASGTLYHPRDLHSISCHVSVSDLQQEYQQTKVLSQPLTITVKGVSRPCLTIVGGRVSQGKDVPRVALGTGKQFVQEQ